MKYMCSLCDYISDSKYSVIRHAGRQTKCGQGESKVIEIECDIICEHCKKSISSMSNLQKHLKLCKKKNIEEMSKINNTGEELSIIMNKLKKIDIKDGEIKKLNEENKKLNEENKKLKEEIKKLRASAVNTAQHNIPYVIINPIYNTCKFKEADLLIMYNNKQIVYLITVENNIIKFGHTNNIKRRMKEHRKILGGTIKLEFCVESIFNREIESGIKTSTNLFNVVNDQLQSRIFSKIYKNNEYTELIYIDNYFTLHDLFKIVNDIKDSVYTADVFNNLNEQINDLNRQIDYLIL